MHMQTMPGTHLTPDPGATTPRGPYAAGTSTAAQMAGYVAAVDQSNESEVSYTPSLHIHTTRVTVPSVWCFAPAWYVYIFTQQLAGCS
jgi:hypothetical protein